MSKEEFLERLNWIKMDLVHMLEIKAENGMGGCNFPIALFTFSCMEWLGFLIRNCRATKTQLVNTSSNIDGCLDLFPTDYQLEIIRKIIKSLFRNGLVHQFGPKYGGISMGNHFGKPIALMPGTFAPVIDADQLANDFINVIDGVTGKINSGEIDYEKIKNKITLTLDLDRKEFEKIIQ